MQTFLPYSNFQQSARCLDRQRLGKQRVECLQILNTLQNGGGWSNHPAVKMWNGYESALREYGLTVCTEWTRRGYRDSCTDKIAAFAQDAPIQMPSWFGDDAFHLSHRSNLKRKMPEHYGLLWPSVPDDLSYVWPV